MDISDLGLIKVETKTPILAILSLAFWGILPHRGIAHWLKRVDSDMDISDFSTRLSGLPYHVDPDGDFHSETVLLDGVTQGFSENRWGFLRPIGHQSQLFLGCAVGHRRVGLAANGFRRRIYVGC